MAQNSRLAIQSLWVEIPAFTCDRMIETCSWTSPFFLISVAVWHAFLHFCETNSSHQTFPQCCLGAVHLLVKELVQQPPATHNVGSHVLTDGGMGTVQVVEENWPWLTSISAALPWTFTAIIPLCAQAVCVWLFELKSSLVALQLRLPFIVGCCGMGCRAMSCSKRTVSSQWRWSKETHFQWRLPQQQFWHSVRRTSLKNG